MRDAIPLERLRVGHWPKAGGGAPHAPAADGFVLDTCQRRLRVTLDGTPAREVAAPPQAFTGAAAYRFLLEVATGLESAVPGETNVFGQFRRAWEAYRATAGREAVAGLAPLVARVIRDTRTVRRRHLENIGGASYGSLARRLLRAAEGERVLFVGAGDLARSMLPFFRACEVGTWNRSAPGPLFAAAGRVFAPRDGAAAADWAHHVILTTPADLGNDARWAAWLGASLAQSVLHLGRRRGEGADWPAHVAAYDLDDVFDLRRSQDTIRSLQLQRARAACRALAQDLAAEAAAPALRRRAAG